MRPAIIVVATMMVDIRASRAPILLTTANPISTAAKLRTSALYSRSSTLDPARPNAIKPVANA